MVGSWVERVGRASGLVCFGAGWCGGDGVRSFARYKMTNFGGSGRGGWDGVGDGIGREEAVVVGGDAGVDGSAIVRFSELLHNLHTCWREK